MDTLPTLCLSKSEKLDDLLEDFGLSEKSKTFFVNKEKIDLQFMKSLAPLKLIISTKLGLNLPSKFFHTQSFLLDVLLI